MKRRSFFSILLATVSVLLLIGFLGFYWIASQSPLNLLQQQSNPATAIFIPRQAPIVASLLVNPDRLDALQRIMVAPGARKRSKAELAELKQRLVSRINLDYEQDIQPWLGEEITLAVTTADIDRDPQNGQQPGYLLAIAAKDPDRSREFLQLFWQKQAIAGVELVFEQYKGVKLISANSQVENKNGFNLTSALVGNRFLLFANHPKVLRDAINNVQAEELSLANSSSYHQALESFTKGRFGLIVVNLPQLNYWLKPDPNHDLQNSGLPYESLAIAPGLNAKGLLAEVAVLASANQRFFGQHQLSEPVGALEYVPANSLLVASGIDLPALWGQLQEGFSGEGTIAQLMGTPLAELQTRWGFNLAEDVFKWMPGEYALGLLPQADRTQFDWIFVTQKTAESEAGRVHLDEIARKQGFGTSPLILGEQEVSAWTRLSTNPSGSVSKANPLTLNAEIEGLYTSTGQYQIFATSPEAMRASLKAPQQPVTRNPDFQRAIAQLSKPNHGYLYINWIDSQPSLEQKFPLFKFFRLSNQPLLDRLQSLTISSNGGSNGVNPALQHGEVFVDLQPLKS